MTNPPTDIRSYVLWYRREVLGGVSIQGVPNPARHAEGCDVYWGSHGCDRPKGHEGAHWCDCCDCDSHPDPDSGCVAGPPYYGTNTSFYGDDA